MRNLKLLLLLVSTLTFLYGKRLNPREENLKHDQTRKNAYHCHPESVSGDTQDETPFSKRKYKPKGVEVDIAHIQNLLPDRIASYRAYSPRILQNVFTSFLYCIDRKRGPPCSILL